MDNSLAKLKNDKFEERLNSLYGLSLQEAQKKDSPLAKICFDGNENRVGWSLANFNWILGHPETIEKVISDAQTIVKKYKYVIFCGMGGSGLSVQVVKSTFGEKETKIYSLRTTDRAYVEDILKIIAAYEKGSIKNALLKLLVIPISKSGKTQETVSHKKYFEDLFVKFSIDVKEHMWVITDKGSPFDTGDFVQREIQLNGRGDIGGRFTAPTTNVFLLPLAIVASEKLELILKRAKDINESSDTYLRFGAFLYENAANCGKDKVTMLVPEELKDVPVWAEQLFEESLGKDGKGVTLFYGEKLSPEVLKPADRDDRVFFRINLNKQKTQAKFWEYLISKGYPVFEVDLDSNDDLGALMLGFQRTVAAIAYLWDINFVNQPAVEGYKKETKKVEQELRSGELKMPDAANSAELNNLVLYYDPLIQAGILTKVEIEKEVKKLGPRMEDAAAIYAAILNILKNRPGFETSELISYARMTKGMTKIFEDARCAIFTQLLKMPAKLGEGPDKNHSFHQNIEGGKDMWLSLYFMPLNTPESKDFVPYDDNLIKAQTLGTMRALVNKGRKVLLLASKTTREEAEPDLAVFFRKTEEYLQGNLTLTN